MNIKRIGTSLFLAISLLLPALSVHGATYRRHRRYYRSSYGQRVHNPIRSGPISAGATAQCVDGTFSFTQRHQGRAVITMA
ncbi:MAG: DUF3761 domain-containing protein [Blastocatellia bacterium]